MLVETKAALGRLKLHGVSKTLDLRLTEASQNGWGYTEVLGALLSDEENYRRQKKTISKIKRARFRIEAHFDHFDYGAKRGLKAAQVKELQGLGFLKKQQNLILLGPTGVGKTFLATAIGHEACKEGFTAAFMGMNMFIEKTALARAQGLRI